MSRRYVKKATFNNLDKVTPEIVAVISAKDNLESAATDQVYFKRNYLDAIRQIIPPFYFSDEQQISGTQISFPNQVINSHILANKNQATILPVSGIPDDNYLSSTNTPAGFSKYFYKQRSPAQIDTNGFQRDILSPLGIDIGSYGTSEAFLNYINGTLLPSIPLVCVGHHETDNLATLTASAFSNDSSGTYKHLANSLGWIYFLNRTGPTNGFDPSTAIGPLLTNTLWRGRSIVLEDSINIYQEYLWKNQQWWTGISDTIIPTDYASGLSISAGIYTSGTQLLDRLKILNNVVYSPEYMNSPDTFVEDSFTNYIDTSTVTNEGALITTTEESGPLARFLEAMSFTMSDRLTEDSEIGVLYDIGKCPDEFLEVLGELIGWRVIGGDTDKWRVQLQNAVDIYKMKGTKRSIQFIIDSLFSTGVFNVTTSTVLSEFWESYIPDLIYYSLATSSVAFKDLNVYNATLAQQFGVVNYSPDNLETNIKYLVDKILFDLVREFPDSFFLGGEKFPVPQLTVSDPGAANDGDIYIGPYHIMGKNGYTDASGNFVWPNFMTGSQHDASSVDLNLVYDPNFIFYYRDRPYIVPPYEKRQYYTATQVTDSMVERIQYYLTCYGVDSAFAKQVADYINEHRSSTLEVYRVLNNFLLFTKQKTYPPNYNNIIQESTKQRTIDPLNLLSLWNGKSSHFLMNFDSSSFDWTTYSLAYNSKYALNRILGGMQQVIPAHAIPEVLLSVSDIADGMSRLGDADCREILPNFNDLYGGSSTVTPNFGVCAVNMGALAVANNITPHRFKRTQVDNINNVLLSGTSFGTPMDGSGARNSLRRRNFKNLLPETKMFTRIGTNNPGSLELSSPFYSSGIGFIPLGFIPSSLKFQGVALRQNTFGAGIGKLIDIPNLHSVWNIEKNLLSSSSVFGYDISNTFASRAKQAVTTSECNTYGRRGQLQEIMYVMNKTHDQEKYLQAQNMVSGYLNPDGSLNPNWASSSPLITPVDFSAWYANNTNYVGDVYQAVSKSIGNHLINKESADQSLNYYENFALGRKVQEFYNTYMTTFSGHGTHNNYNLMGGPNLFSHTFGPLIYNSNLDIDGSGLEASGFLSASSTIYEVDISYYGGSGVLSASGMDNLSIYAVGTSAASDSGDLPLGGPNLPACEFRNQNLVSSIELVDTSTTYAFKLHPIFSLFKLTRDDQSKYSYPKYLINNQIIKYHRSTDPDSLPRIRVKIDNSDSNNKARNFLEPNHSYEIEVKAHNLEVSTATLGGLDLGVWIHTEPELDQVWSYVTQGSLYCGKVIEKWEPLKVLDLSGSQGINMVRNRAQIQTFPLGTLNSMIGSGEGPNPPDITTTYDYRCWEPIPLTTITGANPQAIANINSNSLNTLKFTFSTLNNIAIKPSPLYTSTFDKVHRKNQKYVLEFFVMDGKEEKFVVFEDISIKDITNYNKSVIQTKYGEAQLDISDLKAVFIFLKNLSTGLASRNATITSGTMEVSGGSRLNYRSNIQMYPYDSPSNYEQLEEIYIHEG